MNPVLWFLAGFASGVVALLGVAHAWSAWQWKTRG